MEKVKSQKFNGKKAQEPSISEKIDYQVFNNAEISKETIAEWLDKDVRGIYLLLGEIINSQEIRQAMVDVFYKRYLAHHEAKKNQPELNLNSK